MSAELFVIYAQKNHRKIKIIWKYTILTFAKRGVIIRVSEAFDAMLFSGESTKENA